MGTVVLTNPYIIAPAGGVVNEFDHWWTADAGVTDTSGDVSSWTDQNGGLVLSSQDIADPVLIASDSNLGNQASIDFFNTNAVLSNRGVSTLDLSTVNQFSFWSVVYAQGDGVIYEQSDNSQSVPGCNLRIAAGTGRVQFKTRGTGSSGANSLQTAGSTISTPVAMSLAILYDHTAGGANQVGEITCYLDGVVQTSQDAFPRTDQAGNNGGDAHLSVGCRWAGARADVGNFKIGELGCIKRLLTPTEINELHTTASTKYGL